MTLDEAKRLAGIWKAQEGLAGADLKRLLDELPELLQEHERLREQADAASDVVAADWHETKALRAAARAVLEASAPSVSEAEGVRRCEVLAKLIGFDAGPQPKTGLPSPRSRDFQAMQREMARLCEVLGAEVDATSPGWTFALFVYEAKDDPQNGHVLHGSRDRDRSLAAVAKWVWERLEAQKAKARG